MSEPENIVVFREPAAIEAEAATWIARLTSGRMSAEDRQAFREWQNRSIHHREAVARLWTVWSEFEALKGVAGFLERPPEPTFAQALSRWVRHISDTLAARPKAVGAAFTAILIAVGLTAVMVVQAAHFNRSHQTAIGAQKTIALSDGSTVLLNTNSHVDIRFSESAREVTLLRGEAYFEVAHDENRPFIVSAGNGAVRALGTAFDVRMLGDAVEVTVTKGRVALSSTARDSATEPGSAEAISPQLAPRPLATLSAGQSATYGDGIERLINVPDVIIKRALAWRSGFIMFSDERLESVLKDISRYTELQFRIENEKLRDLKITGYFEVGRIDALLEALELNFGLRVDRAEGGLVRLSPTAHATL